MSQQRITTRTYVFRHPFFLKAVGTELPAGSYEVEFTESTIALHGNIQWVPTRCSLAIPHGVLDARAYGAAVDSRELERVHAEDQAKP
jgi:hypothetical protein